MMTHIYIRLGDWQKAVDWNTVSADSAWELCVQTGEINLHYTHALDYLAYSYLQMGQDDAAAEILATAEELQPPYSVTNRDASAYAFAALPARIALERREWEAAASLQPRRPATFPWEPSHDAYVAITHFSRAIGMTRSGKHGAATSDIKTLGDIRRRISASNPYWAEQVEIQHLAARAWQQYASGDVDTGLETMAAAADLEESTEKHAVTPGEVLPAAELYGDMLLDVGRHEAALAAYRRALARSPKRFNSVFGAGQAADGMGDAATARRYFEELLSIASGSEKHRPAVAVAREYLERA